MPRSADEKPARSPPREAGAGPGIIFALLFLLALLSTPSSAGQGRDSASLPWIKVSENGRFLVTETGEPFFWLADTAWELFNRLTREEAELYLTDRAEKGFTVIQAAVIAQFAGIAGGNAYGDTPLVD
jgi:hypothetical protein